MTNAFIQMMLALERGALEIALIFVLIDEGKKCSGCRNIIYHVMYDNTPPRSEKAQCWLQLVSIFLLR